MNWTPGPARCRSPECEAEILATDMGGDRPILMRVRDPNGFCDWRLVSLHSNGQFCGQESGYDLMPSTITREALAEEVLQKYGAPQPFTLREQAMAVVAHVVEAVKSGRVE